MLMGVLISDGENYWMKGVQLLAPFWETHESRTRAIALWREAGCLSNIVTSFEYLLGQ
jgi:hypothetical protein